MPTTQDEERIASNIAAACQGLFRDPPEERDPGRLRQFCIEFVRRGQCAVYTYASDEGRFWLALREEGRRGWCHYLDERPVLHGETIEIWQDGRWIRARYHAEGLGDRSVVPDCVLEFDTKPASLLHLKHTDEVVIARWPRSC